MAGYKKLISRKIYLVISVMLFLSIAVPLLGTLKVAAYTTMTFRSIQLSNSAVSATTVSYLVQWTAADPGANTVKGVVVDFCTDPIISDPCTAPTGLAVSSSSTPTITLGSNTTNLTTFAAELGSTSVYTTITITGSTGNSFTGGTTVGNFTITGVTNPSTLGSFYARIVTYSTTADALSYSHTNLGSNVDDAGGVALSTAAQITITAKVEEQITFCVYTGANCAAGGTSIGLGDTNEILSTLGPYVDKTTEYDISTNASHGGADINMVGPTLTATNGSGATIPQISTTPIAPTTGVSQFGLCTYETAGANLTPAAPYNGSNCSTTTQTAGLGGGPGGAGTADFALDTNASTGTTSTYGETIATATAGPASTGTIAFIGNISNSQAPGVYQTKLTFVATGIY